MDKRPGSFLAILHGLFGYLARWSVLYLSSYLFRIELSGKVGLVAVKWQIKNKITRFTEKESGSDVDG